MPFLRAIKKDKVVAQLRRGLFVKGQGFFIYWLWLPRGSGVSPAVLEVAIRVGRCHKRAVERNKIRRWILEILRQWGKENFDNIKKGDQRLSLLISVAIRNRDALNFWYVREVLLRLLNEVISQG